MAACSVSLAVSAEPKPKPARKAQPVKAGKKKPAETKADASEAKAEKTDEKADTKEKASDAKAEEASASDTQAGSVQGAGTKAATGGNNDAKGPDVVNVKEKEGVKSYQFGAIEVEGRLKSPQVIYFLRRVRAEFDAAHLGHRSFLGELSDTRRHPSLR